MSCGNLSQLTIVVGKCNIGFDYSIYIMYYIIIESPLSFILLVSHFIDVLNYTPLISVDPDTRLLPRILKNLDNTRKREFVHTELQLRTEDIDLNLQFEDLNIFNIKLSYFHLLVFLYDYHTHCDECYSFDIKGDVDNVYISDVTEDGKLHPCIYILNILNSDIKTK